jgi:hypothetical protein
MANDVYRAGEAELQVALSDDFSDAQIVGRVTNVTITRSPSADVIREIGSFVPTESFYLGEDAASFSFQITPTQRQNLKDMNLMADSADRGAYAGCHMRLTGVRGTLSVMRDCFPQGNISGSLAALGKLDANYTGIARVCNLFEKNFS